MGCRGILSIGFGRALSCGGADSLAVLGCSSASCRSADTSKGTGTLSASLSTLSGCQYTLLGAAISAHSLIRLLIDVPQAVLDRILLVGERWVNYCYRCRMQSPGWRWQALKPTQYIALRKPFVSTRCPSPICSRSTLTDVAVRDTELHTHVRHKS